MSEASVEFADQAISNPRPSEEGDRSWEFAIRYSVNFEFSGEIWYWRGPSPFHFVTVPDHQSQDIKDISGFVTMDGE